LDSLCQTLRKHHGLVPPTFRELFVEHVWYDGLAESLTLLNKTFTLALAGKSASAIEQVALDWAATFPSQGPLQQTPAYQSLLQLREVALDTVAQTKSLLFYLEGHPAFFRW
jgi:hypothetical protein